MANEEHLAQLRAGVSGWNAWRKEHPDVVPDLRQVNLSRANLKKANFIGADLSKADLYKADLEGAKLEWAHLSHAELIKANLPKANLFRANLFRAKLEGAKLEGAKLIGAHSIQANLSYAILINVDLTDAILRRAQLPHVNLTSADLSRADLKGADLSHANLFKAYLSKTDLSGANLSGADLERAVLVGTNLKNSDLTDCRVYGISTWDLELEGAKQRDLVITTGDQPEITVDNLEVAQFIYLLLHNEKIRHVIDTITSKVVLILGRFTPERKAVLDALREELRKRDYLPVLFDFAPSQSRDITETVSLLARMARFVVVDITDARSIPQELSIIVPDLPSVPVQPLLQEGAGEYGMFEHFRRYPWVLETYYYPSIQYLIAALGERVISPAEAKVRELRG